MEQPKDQKFVGANLNFNKNRFFVLIYQRNISYNSVKKVLVLVYHHDIIKRERYLCVLSVVEIFVVKGLAHEQCV